MFTRLSQHRLVYWLLIGFSITALLGACMASTSAPNSSPTTPATPEHNEHTGEEHTSALPALTAVQLGQGEKLRVVATLNLIGDVVQQVGGEHIELTTLLPVGADPHSYAATPADLRTLANAHVVFMIGGGLEEALAAMLSSAEGQATLVSVNAGLELRAMEEPAEEGADHEHGGNDPHTWTSIPNVQHWVENIEHVLSTLDPTNAGAYQAAAATYQDKLAQLEAEITGAIAAIPAEQRKLVTDHEVFGYFAEHYGFTVVGSVVPGLSTLATPSAQELAALQDQIGAEGVKAIFVGNTVNPALAKQLANDLGIQVVPLYSESLSTADGPAATYLDFMRTNVQAIVAALQ